MFFQGTFHGSFTCQAHSLAYQGRGAMPTNFDCDLGYTMGYGAGPRKGFLKHFCNLFLQNNDEKQENHIIFNDLFIILMIF